MDIKERKRLLRKEVKEVTASLPESYRRDADRRIAELILDLSEYKNAGTVFCFVSTPDEIDTFPVISDAWKNGKRVAVPRVEGKGIMRAYEIRNRSDLEEGFYGICEPKQGTPLIPPEELDFIIMPCLTAARDGRRLGYGGGFYDRYMERLDTPCVVICREKVMRDDIPADSYDVKIETVISEAGIYRQG